MTEGLALLGLLAILSALGTWAYSHFALQRGIIAKITFRSLHTRLIPRGAGVVFALLFAALVAVLSATGQLPTWMGLVLGMGGASATTLGFLDDVHEHSPKVKLGGQVLLSLGGLILLYDPIYSPFFSRLPAGSGLALGAFLLFLPVWFVNVYNFIDGIDGLAITTAIFICLGAITVLLVSGGSSDFVLVFALLAFSGTGFLFFNLPPAKVFMGDAGSGFLGYVFIMLALATVFEGQISLWTWIALLSFILGDTTVTNLYRLLFVPKWYGAHRSHAYQNLARTQQSHAKVTYGIVAFHLLWALPWAVLSALHPEWGATAAVSAVAPALLWAWKYGPRFSRD